MNEKRNNFFGFKYMKPINFIGLIAKIRKARFNWILEIKNMFFVFSYQNAAGFNELSFEIPVK